ncbi:MAG: DUF3794 domain-containing protein [Clostridia bacterium]|nr:DUF3794 domain-containing protein [Clostridia bacterium]
MSIKPQYETYRYTGEIARLKSQSIVECRLPGSEIGTVLAASAKAVAIECTCVDGEVRYNGKLYLCIVYEDGNRKICRVERGAEFFHKAEGADVTPACFAKTAFQCENVSYRREGSGLYVSVIIGADISVYGGRQIEYLTGGEGVIANKQPMTLTKTTCVSGETEAEDEFEADYVGDILLHSENAVVTSVAVRTGELDIEGEMTLNVCVLKSDESVCSYERVIPFHIQLPCDEAFGNVRATARVNVKQAQLTAGVDEEKGKSKIVLSYTLAADCFLYTRDELTVALDAFSPQASISLKRENGRGRYLTNQVKCVQRVGGLASLSPALEGEYTLKAALLSRGETVCKRTENGGWEAEGFVTAEILLSATEGGYRSATLTLPFVVPLDNEGEYMEADCIVCGLNVRRKKDGETEAEATLKMCVRTYEEAQWEYVSLVTEGEAYAETDAALSIYTLRAGEGLWEAAKRLCRDPEELQKSNPALEFPVKEGERIFVYRQKK